MQFPLVYTGDRVTVEKISDRLYFRQGDLNERRQCNGGYVVTQDGVVAVDAPSVEAAHEMVEECRQLFDRPIVALVLTHPHPDHVLGLDALLALTGPIPVYAGRGAGAEMREQGVKVPENLVEIDDKRDVEVGQVFLHLEKLPMTAHSPWDLMLYLRHEQALFCGDVVVLPREMYFKDCSLSGWEQTLGELQHRVEVTLLRGHGEAMDTGCLKEQKRFLHALRAVYAALKAGGRVARPYTEETVKPLFDEMVDRGDENAKAVWRVSNQKIYYQLFKLFVSGREA